MKKNLLGILSAAVLLFATTTLSNNNIVCGNTTSKISDNDWPQPAKLFIELPDYCPTPDALAIAPDGNLTLSCPNYVDKNQPGLIVQINKQKDVKILAKIKRPNGNGYVCPVGIAYDNKGALYVCDNGGQNKGSILKLSFNDGELINTEVIAQGINAPNGLRYFDGSIYVTTPKLPEIQSDKLTSGVWRFEDSERNITVSNNTSDSHLIFTAQTQNPNRQFGLDGLVFNSKGNLLVGDFGDGTIYELTLSNKGQVTNKTVYAQLPNTSGIDGMIMDDSDNLYTVGFSLNQVLKVDADKNISVIAQYADNNGKNGELDQPADLIIYNKQLIIANFDLMVSPGMVNSQHSKPYTLSYIDL